MRDGGPHAAASLRAWRLVAAYGPPLALMAVIWALSSRSHLGTGLGTIDLVLRKLAHMTEFGLLAALWTRALLRHRGATRALAVGAAIAVAWAAVDELHQSAVPGRHGTPVDVAIDAAGVAIAVTLLRRWWSRERPVIGR